MKAGIAPEEQGGYTLSLRIDEGGRLNLITKPEKGRST